MADGMSDEALRIADYFDTGYGHFGERKRAAALLRQQHAEIERLTEQCDKLLSRPAYAAGYGAGYDAGFAFGLQWAAAQIEARAHVVGEQPWHGAIASELYAMAERIRNEK